MNVVNVVCVAQQVLGITVRPLQHHFAPQTGVLILRTKIDYIRMQLITTADQIAAELPNAILKDKLTFLLAIRTLINKLDSQSTIQKGKLTQARLKSFITKLAVRENSWVRCKAHQRPSKPCRWNLFQPLNHLAPSKRHAVALPIPPDFDVERLR